MEIGDIKSIKLNPFPIAVILNEHLTEALRRLRANTTDSTVDGRLITNLLLQFLNAPRTDSKRFEMLSLIGSVLNWTANEREKAGLQRITTSNGSTSKTIGVKKENRGQSSANTAGEESFSNLFVEFLLSEAEKAKGPLLTSPPGSPTGDVTISPIKATSRPSFNLGSLASLGRGMSFNDTQSPSSEINNVSPGKSANGSGGGKS